MADEYIISCTMHIDGEEETNFSEVTEKAITRAKQVELMNKTGSAGKIPRYGLSLVYVYPRDTTPRDFSLVKNATVTIIYDGGLTRTYMGVRTLSEGDHGANGNEEMKATIEFCASNRIPK